MSIPNSVNGINRDRLYLERLIQSTDISSAVSSDVIAGLSKIPKTLPTKYLYDDRGSLLFEQICELPEYYLTRTETAILQNYAAEIARTTGPCELVELGSGSAIKTRILLDAYKKLDYPLRYLPIDISAGILESSAFDLLADYPTLEVHGLVGTYEQALQQLTLPHLPTRMLCFLGSTLGNLRPQECDIFFSQISSSLRSGEYFLLGVDLHKSKILLEPAYDDAQGVSAAFCLNILNHINQKFDGDFELSQFEYVSFYNEVDHQIEMYLRSRVEQSITLRSLDFTCSFTVGELVLAEISRKFDLNELEQELASRNLHKIKVWTDPNQWFGLLLCQVGD